MLDELVRGGLRPEDLSLVASLRSDPQEDNPAMFEYAKSVGDATSYVGREDDPVRVVGDSDIVNLSGYTTIEESPISGIDTSDIGTDVETVDQADDSQEIAEEMIYPRDGVSQGDHQSDDQKLSVLTGYPTAVTREDNVWDRGAEQDQLDETLETIVVPGVGLVAGGGGLATAALEELSTTGAHSGGSIVAYLCDEGMPEPLAETYRAAYLQGDAVVAIAITAGALAEGDIERLAIRHHASQAGLYDAPRY